MATTSASGAMPRGATRPSEVMMPVTLVPWPLSSGAEPAPPASEAPPGQQEAQKQCSSRMLEARSGCDRSTPVSSTATTTPRPVTPRFCTSSARMRLDALARGREHRLVEVDPEDVGIAREVRKAAGGHVARDRADGVPAVREAKVGRGQTLEHAGLHGLHLGHAVREGGNRGLRLAQGHEHAHPGRAREGREDGRSDLGRGRGLGPGRRAGGEDEDGGDGQGKGSGIQGGPRRRTGSGSAARGPSGPGPCLRASGSRLAP